MVNIKIIRLAKHKAKTNKVIRDSYKIIEG